MGTSLLPADMKRRGSASLQSDGRSKNTGEELLWPERFDETAIEALEKKLGSHSAAGQLQQRPAPAAGLKFKRPGSATSRTKTSIIRSSPRRGEALREGKLLEIQTCDPAATEDKRNDYTVLGPGRNVRQRSPTCRSFQGAG